MIVDPNVAGQRAVVGKDNRISHNAIVPDVAIGEKISAVGNLCLAIAVRAAIHGHKFAKSIFIADFKVSRLACVF